MIFAGPHTNGLTRSLGAGTDIVMQALIGK